MKKGASEMKARKKLLLFCMAIVIGLAACGTNIDESQKNTNENVKDNEKVTETPKITVTDKPDLETTLEPIPTVSPEPTIIPEKKLASVEKIEKASVGDCVTFGTYEQDNDYSKAEDIEWIVLDKQDGKALLLSKFVLSGQAYNIEDKATTWENCSLRKWLNEEFYLEAFNDEEKEVVAEVLLRNPDNRTTKIDGGNNTEDNVFILSLEEVATYFYSESSQLKETFMASMTDVAFSQGVTVSKLDGDRCCYFWWLRTPGDTEYNVIVATSSGTMPLGPLDSSSIGVRPAVWVTFDSDVEQKEQEKVVRTVNYEEIRNAKVGEKIKFGAYEQDNDFRNGEEAIEWIVLDKKDGKALLLSEYILASKEYHIEFAPMTWEKCTLRKWLNEEFYQTAFNEKEQNLIVESLIVNPDNAYTGVDGGKNTRDKMFLLSIDEVLHYFDSDPKTKDLNRCAIETRAAAFWGYSSNIWWLRSLGGYSTAASYVFVDGTVDCYSPFTVDMEFGVRPAMWVNYESEQQEIEVQQPEKTESVNTLDKVFLGDCVLFGNYEQDNDYSNGKEEIEWVVLDKKDGEVLLLSKKVLSVQEYNKKNASVTWENCSLRNWLNNEFYYVAFNEEEQNKIQATVLQNQDNPSSGAEGGNDTKDKVFMLSVDEATEYFISDRSNAKSIVTEQADFEGAYSDNGYGTWWLRTIGIGSSCASYVQTDGKVVYESTYPVNLSGIGVRPAIWVKY